MPEKHYDPQLDAHLKEIGDRLVAILQRRIMRKTPNDPWGAFSGATAVAEVLAGFLPTGDGPNKKSDEEIAAAIQRVERVLAIIAEANA